jgi:hypothetical protein
MGASRAVASASPARPIGSTRSRTVVKDGRERFACAYLDDASIKIRLLADHRADLVAERTRMHNRLRWPLVALCPQLERAIKPRTSTAAVSLTGWGLGHAAREGQRLAAPGGSASGRERHIPNRPTSQTCRRLHGHD